MQPWGNAPLILFWPEVLEMLWVWVWGHFRGLLSLGDSPTFGPGTQWCGGDRPALWHLLEPISPVPLDPLGSAIFGAVGRWGAAS